MILFADDTTTLSHGKTAENVTSDIQASLNEINDYAKNNRLLQHPSKTKWIVFCKKSKVVPVEDLVELQIDGHKVEYAESYKCLGFTLGEHLDYALHLKEKSRKINYGLQIIRRVRPILPTESLISIANSVVLSHLDYCSPQLYNMSTYQINVLAKLQKRCARAIFSMNRRSRSKPLFVSLNWLPIHQRIEFSCATLIFHIVNGLAPPYMSSLFNQAKNVHSHNTRFGANNSLHSSRQHQKSFSYYGMKIWKSLPMKIRDSKTVESFKKQCKEHLMSNVSAEHFEYSWTI